MNKIVLLLEDNDGSREHTAELLRKKSYDVEDYSRIDQAKEFFKKNIDEIICIVTDLNMSDEWLGEYRSKSYGGILSGWVWLYYFVFPEKPDMPTVIYSGFLDELRANISSEQLSLLETKNIKCVAKGTSDNEGFNGLQRAIEEVIKKGATRL